MGHRHSRKCVRINANSQSKSFENKKKTMTLESVLPISRRAVHFSVPYRFVSSEIEDTEIGITYKTK